MSLAYFADSKAIVLRPGITKDRSDLTKEEWLGRLQKKSIERGRPITWREIKDDPSLDHDQILSKLGPYTTYENRLFCSVRDVVQSTEVLTGMARRNRQAAAAVKIRRNYVVPAGTEPLIELRVPDDNTALWSPYYIVVGSLNEAEAETWLGSYRLGLTECYHDFSRATLRRIFNGKSKAHCIFRAAVYSDHIEFDVRPMNPLSADIGVIQRITATVKSKVDTRLFLGVMKRGEESSDEHVICNCKNVGGKTVISILQQQLRPSEV